MPRTPDIVIAVAMPVKPASVCFGGFSNRFAEVVRLCPEPDLGDML
jgi:hypothetical protein